MRPIVVVMMSAALLVAGACSDDSGGGGDTGSSAPDSAVYDYGNGFPDGTADAGGKKPDSDTGSDGSIWSDVGSTGDGQSTDGSTVGSDGAPTLDGAAASCSSDGYLAAPDGALTTDGGMARDGGKVTCASPGVVLEEVAIGLPDYVALKNAGSQTVDIKGYRLEMSGISPISYTVSASHSVAAGAVVYIFEYSNGKKSGDINTKANIPFWDGPPSATGENSVALYDAQGRLLDYMGSGTYAKNIPNGATFAPLAYPSGFRSSSYSWQRRGHKGSCPKFASGDWGAACLTR